MKIGHRSHRDHRAIAVHVRHITGMHISAPDALPRYTKLMLQHVNRRHEGKEMVCEIQILIKRADGRGVFYRVTAFCPFALFLRAFASVE